MLRYLRDFGFGRRFEELESETRDEFQMFIEIIKHGPKYDHERVSGFEKFIKAKLYLSISLSEIYQRAECAVPQSFCSVFIQRFHQDFVQSTNGKARHGQHD